MSVKFFNSSWQERRPTPGPSGIGQGQDSSPLQPDDEDNEFAWDPTENRRHLVPISDEDQIDEG